MPRKSKVLKGYIPNFETLKRACINGDLALVDLQEVATGKSVAGVCAIGFDGKEYNIVPIAIMIAGNPYEMFRPPATTGPNKYEGDSDAPIRKH